MHARNLILAVTIAVSFGFIANTSEAQRTPERIAQLSQSLNDATRRLEQQGGSLFGSGQAQTGNPFSKLIERFKPKFSSSSDIKPSLMDRLKKLSPFLDKDFATKPKVPFLSGLSNLFQPKEKKSLSFLDRLTGKSKNQFGSAISEGELSLLNNMAKRGIDQGTEFTRQAKRGVSDLFNGQSQTDNFPRPPRRAAQQGSTSKY